MRSHLIPRRRGGVGQPPLLLLTSTTPAAPSKDASRHFIHVAALPSSAEEGSLQFFRRNRGRDRLLKGRNDSEFAARSLLIVVVHQRDRVADKRRGVIQLLLDDLVDLRLRQSKAVLDRVATGSDGILQSLTAIN